MPQQISDINIQKDILRLLDKVVKTGVPLEIERNRPSSMPKIFY
jgi:hypothetical protein